MENKAIQILKNIKAVLESRKLQEGRIFLQDIIDITIKET